MLTRRAPFPAVYLLFLLPLLSSSAALKTAVLFGCPILALVISFRHAIKMLSVVATALATLLPLLFIVQASICTSPGAFQISTGSFFLHCVTIRSTEVLLNVCMLSSVSLLSAANEWQGSLCETINRMTLPRSIRIMVIVSGAMIGGFRRAMYKVHHAFTSRGEAFPSFNWRNAVALPTMLGVAWASELNSVVSKVRGPWASEAFWERFVPASPNRRNMGYSMGDVLILIASITISATAATDFIGGRTFS